MCWLAQACSVTHFTFIMRRSPPNAKINVWADVNANRQMTNDGTMQQLHHIKLQIQGQKEITLTQSSR